MPLKKPDLAVYEGVRVILLLKQRIAIDAFHIVMRLKSGHLNASCAEITSRVLKRN